MLLNTSAPKVVLWISVVLLSGSPCPICSAETFIQGGPQSSDPDLITTFCIEYDTAQWLVPCVIGFYLASLLVANVLLLSA